jgi:dTDP-4-amino-4,6-dideoxygalactose transaminase
MTRIYLSPPDVGPLERARLLEAFDSGWIAPLGPEVDAFEVELCRRLGGDLHGVALSSGTAGLHLGLIVAGVERGDVVLVSDLTFVATANAIRYVGAEPVFIDSDRSSWNMDPDLLATALEKYGKRVKAVVSVDLYGQCARYDRIEELCRSRGVPLLEDAAEALGADHGGRPAGTFGDAAVFSFNGNKIMTTSGGGMFVSADRAWAQRVRYLATQAREPLLHYEHVAVGYNYRLSNLLAAVGRAQLERLDELVERRRAIRREYVVALGELPGLDFMPELEGGRSNAWLTVLTVDPARFGCDRDVVIARLAAADIEARPLWKPMHQQPCFAGVARVGGEVADELFAGGLCLPSGSTLTLADQRRVCDLVRAAHEEHR